MKETEYDGTVNEDEIGVSVIRMQNDTASMNEVAAVLNMLIKSEDFRERCRVLGKMVAHLPRRKLEENAEASAHLIFAKHLPAEEAPEPGRDWVRVDPRFIVQGSPMRDSIWASHFDAKYSAHDAMSEATASPYVQAILGTIEEMWNVPGHLLNKR